MADPPIICRRCHKGGHHAFACPEATTGNRSERGGRGPPPSKCWTCELINGADANHWGDECPVAAQRLKDRQCTLCGSSDHWKKGCPRYQAEKHKARNPTTTYWPTGPQRSAISSCLRCGVKGDHPTMECTAAGPPIILPDPSDADDLQDVCLWCSIEGHSHQSCMRRAPVQAKENAVAIAGLTDRVDALQKSVTDCTPLSGKVSTLEGQMSSLMAWKSTTEGRLTVLETWQFTANNKYVARSSFDAFVEEKFTPTQRQAARAVPTSTFDDFVNTRFLPTEQQASASVPAQSFNDYVTRMEQAGFKPASEDTAMSTPRLTGAPRTASETQDVESPGQTAKERAAKRAHTPSGASGSSSSSSFVAPTPRTPAGAAAFGEVSPLGAPWLALKPTESSQWSEDALDLLFSEWMAHMDSRLQQWASKHLRGEMKGTVETLARDSWSPEKKKGISAVLTASRVPVRLFTNINR